MLDNLPGSRRLDDLHGSRLWKSSAGQLHGSRLLDNFLEVVRVDDFQSSRLVYGEWSVKDDSWDFVVDKAKGARIFFLSEGFTHAELVEKVVEDYNMEAEVVELTYLLPEAMRHQDTPLFHVTSDRQEDVKADDLGEDYSEDEDEEENEEDNICFEDLKETYGSEGGSSNVMQP
ncbi:hypothetical protein N665_0069s0017 [Sinapis alba]|nr:hypothetical protein N665_0069s0017 [Sinapis alba]